MPAAQGNVATARAERYLTQLCGHLGRLPHRATGHGPTGHRGPQITGASRDGSNGTITFAGGTCTLEATGSALKIHVEAGDQATLDGAREQIEHRIRTIGRREELHITWQ